MAAATPREDLSEDIYHALFVNYGALPYINRDYLKSFVVHRLADHGVILERFPQLQPLNFNIIPREDLTMTLLMYMARAFDPDPLSQEYRYWILEEMGLPERRLNPSAQGLFQALRDIMRSVEWLGGSWDRLRAIFYFTSAGAKICANWFDEPEPMSEVLYIGMNAMNGNFDVLRGIRDRGGWNNYI